MIIEENIKWSSFLTYSEIEAIPGTSFTQINVGGRLLLLPELSSFPPRFYDLHVYIFQAGAET